MIALENVTRLQRTNDGTLMLLLNVTEVFRRDERVGILAIAGSGKSSIARLLSGIETADGGTIRRDGKVSWPIGFAGGFHPDLSVMENLIYLSGLTGQDPLETIAFCLDFADLGNIMDKPVKTISSAQRAAISYSFSLAVACDMYIADEVIGIGDTEMRFRCQAMLDRRLQKAGLIFLSKNPAQLKQHCNRFLLLVDGKLVHCDDLDVGAQTLALALERNHNQPLTVFDQKRK